MIIRRLTILFIAVLLIGGAILYLETIKVKPMTKITNRLNLNTEGKVRAPELVNPAAYINSSGITIDELKGKKVVLVDFWTYSCINCQRTIPYLKDWYAKYKDQGLEIIGVHTPEFAFEKKYDNVRREVERWGIDYPVVLDNDYATWQAYANRYWPHKYLIDKDGYIVYDHIGEGGYEDTEKVIVRLLSDLNNDEVVAVSSAVEEQNVEHRRIQTPEIYFGAQRNQWLGNAEPGQVGEVELVAPAVPEPNKFYLVGKWFIGPESVVAREAGAKILIRYTAKDVYMVAGAEPTVNAKIYLNGDAEIESSGQDVINGKVNFGDERLYKLIQGDDYGSHVLEIEVEDSGLEVFTFTFG
ncbi:MAG: redoxin family protein [Candidatus Komeilibacteria bacterium]|nr:redoxin family protein [Candidatus Komeilibacteria bacterium]